MNAGTGPAAADLLIRSRAVFTGLTDAPTEGFVAVRGDRIVDVGEDDGRSWIGPRTEVVDVGDGLVTAAFHDNHTFVTGTILDELQVPVADCTDARQVVDRLLEHCPGPDRGLPVIGAGWSGSTDGVEEEVARRLPERRVVLWDADRTAVWQNAAAGGRYGLRGGEVSNEALAPVFVDAAADPERVRRLYAAMERELFRRGVVSIKDVAFDDYAGVLPVLAEMVEGRALSLRVHFVSQPVQRPYDLDFGARAAAHFTGLQLRFHGFKLMTDGIAPEGTADMLDGYVCGPRDSGGVVVDYERLGAAVRAIDAAGHAVCLNVDGDGAARWAVGALEDLRSAGGGHPLNSMSDVSFIAASDLERAGRLGLTVEVYPQFLLLFDSAGEFGLERVVGPAVARMNDFAGMRRSGLNISAGTDLPLFLPSIPDSIASATYRRFADGSPAGGWHPEGAISTAEVLRAWSIGGARACGIEEQVGTLEPGKRADIAALDVNVFESGPQTVREASVALTVAGGSVVYAR